MLGSENRVVDIDINNMCFHCLLLSITLACFIKILFQTKTQLTKTIVSYYILHLIMNTPNESINFKNENYLYSLLELSRLLTSL